MPYDLRMTYIDYAIPYALCPMPYDLALCPRPMNYVYTLYMPFALCGEPP